MEKPKPMELSSAMSTEMAQRIELWPIERLIPYERNARTHSDHQIRQIANSHCRVWVHQSNPGGHTGWHHRRPCAAAGCAPTQAAAGTGYRIEPSLRGTKTRLHPGR